MSSSDLDKILSELKNLNKIKENEIKNICLKSKEIFKEEPNIIYLESPITICGDIHGQFDDLLELFQIGGKPPETNFLFLGDYVDRGYNSIETILTFLILKIKYSDRITLLRGNHESKFISQTYGLYDECMRKYNSINIWHYLCEVFDTIPLAAIIDNKLFCIHGGLSPNLNYIDDIININRFTDIPHKGTFSDLLWSDPDNEIKGFKMSPRGAGYLFGEDVVKKFCHNNGFDTIVRAHQLIREGFKVMFDEKLITVWSAPNYCYRCGNVASIMEVDEDLNKEFKIFEAAPQAERIYNKKEALDYFL
jgi:serine/threonine-protein phosphatase 4 catalytic subunit